MNNQYTLIMLAAVSAALDPAAVNRRMIHLADKAPIDPSVLFNLHQNRYTYGNNHRTPKAMRPEAMGSREFRRQYHFV